MRYLYKKMWVWGLRQIARGVLYVRCRAVSQSVIVWVGEGAALLFAEGSYQHAIPHARAIPYWTKSLDITSSLAKS